MKSQIITLEKIIKNDFKNSSRFYPCYIDNDFALFTRSQLDVAITRGQKREDLVQKQSWLFKLFIKFLS